MAEEDVSVTRQIRRGMQRDRKEPLDANIAGGIDGIKQSLTLSLQMTVSRTVVFKLRS